MADRVDDATSGNAVRRGLTVSAGYARRTHNPSTVRIDGPPVPHTTGCGVELGGLATLGWRRRVSRVRQLSSLEGHLDVPLFCRA